jgi:hypothetical protein
MTKNTIVLLAVAVILGACYVFFFTGWFDKDTIQIISTIRPVGRRTATAPRAKGEAQTYDVSFSFNGKYQFTKVRVIAADDLRTNKFPTPLWDLMSDSQSVPTKYLVYGEQPKGMKPAIPRSRAQPLQPDVEYVLLIEAGKISARTNFHTRELAAPESR